MRVTGYENPWTRFILGIILAQQLRTHSLLLSGGWIENSAAFPYQDALLNVWPEVSFNDFAAAIKYWKDFDTAETAPGELWSGNRLGSRTGVLADGITTLRAGDPGENADNPARITFYLKQSLTCHTRAIFA